jgi:hypothetical protein
MQQLLMDNILPMACRRKPVNIILLLKQPNIDAIFKYYEDALKELYKCYTISSALNKKGKALQRSVKSSANNPFDDNHQNNETMGGGGGGGGGNGNNNSNNNSNKSKGGYDQELASHQMSYADFMRFANDFGLVSR